MLLRPGAALDGAVRGRGEYDSCACAAPNTVCSSLPHGEAQLKVVKLDLINKGNAPALANLSEEVLKLVDAANIGKLAKLTEDQLTSEASLNLTASTLPEPVTTCILTERAA